MKMGKICRMTGAASARSRCAVPGSVAAITKSEDAGSRDAEGWFATGDVGSIDADGYLHITDRQKDLIKCAGEWISSVEIENLATEHPAVMQAAAIGIPDEKWGERPVLIVVPQPESNVSERDILALYDARVAKWCVPVRVIFVENLPVGATGKVQKNMLRQLYARPGAKRM
jgi:3-(methylthio)propionyl---CoA ligase